jgi:hypothetical protein
VRGSQRTRSRTHSLHFIEDEDFIERWFITLIRASSSSIGSNGGEERGPGVEIATGTVALGGSELVGATSGARGL